MTDNAKKFLEEASKNGALKAELAKALSGSNTNIIAGVAKANGYEVKPEDFVGLMVEVLSGDELEAVAGGIRCGNSETMQPSAEDMAGFCFHFSGK